MAYRTLVDLVTFLLASCPAAEQTAPARIGVLEYWVQTSFHHSMNPACSQAIDRVQFNACLGRLGHISFFGSLLFAIK
jgi:hypothetical protein